MPKPARKTRRRPSPGASAGRKAKATRGRATSLSRPWSAEDVRALRRLAGNTPRVQIARQLGRSPGAVTFKAFTLEISLRLRRAARAKARAGRR